MSRPPLGARKRSVALQIYAPPATARRARAAAKRLEISVSDFGLEAIERALAGDAAKTEPSDA